MTTTNEHDRARAGLTAEWAPSSRAPIALQLGASAGLVEPIITRQGADGYWPFSDDITLRRLQLGLVWRGRGSMAQR